MRLQISQDNRRCAYRVTPFATDHLQLNLRSAQQSLVPDLISDVTSRGASVCFNEGNIPDLITGDELTVSIVSPNLSGKVNLAARIAFIGDHPRGRLIGLSFVSNSDLLSHANRDLLRLFNRRAAYRGVEPETSNGLFACVQTAPLALRMAAKARTVTVRNISTTGVCLRIGEALDAQLQGSQQILLLVQLPGSVVQREYCARIRNRAESAGEVFYGCHFDWGATDNALEAVEELAGYTMERMAREQDAVTH